MQSTLKNELWLLIHRQQQFFSEWNDDTHEGVASLEETQARQLYENAYQNWVGQVKPFLEKCIKGLQVDIVISGGVCHVDRVDSQVILTVKDYDVDEEDYGMFNMNVDEDGDHYVYNEFKGEIK